MKGIYAIWNAITNEYYIGQATNLQNRKRQHLGAYRKKSNARLQRAIAKYGIHNFHWSVLETVSSESPKERLTAREQYWVDCYKANGIRLYNFNLECVDSCKGVNRSEEHKQAIRQSNATRATSIETREKMRKAKLGTKTSLGRLYSQESVEKNRLSNCKYYYLCISSSGEIDTFRSLRHYCEERGLDTSLAGKVAKGIYKQYKGYVFYKFLTESLLENFATEQFGGIEA